jgi:hypothetical protein
VLRLAGRRRTKRHGVVLDIGRRAARARVGERLQRGGVLHEGPEDDDARVCVIRRVPEEIRIVDPELASNELPPNVRRHVLELRELRVHEVPLERGNDEEVDHAERPGDQHGERKGELRADAPQRVHSEAPLAAPPSGRAGFPRVRLK